MKGDKLGHGTLDYQLDKKGCALTRHFQLCRVSGWATLLRAVPLFCLSRGSNRQAPNGMPPIFIEVYAKGMTEDAATGNYPGLIWDGLLWKLPGVAKRSASADRLGSA